MDFIDAVAKDLDLDREYVQHGIGLYGDDETPESFIERLEHVPFVADTKSLGRVIYHMKHKTKRIRIDAREKHGNGYITAFIDAKHFNADTHRTVITRMIWDRNSS